MHTPVQHQWLTISAIYVDNNESKMEMSTAIVNTCGFKESHHVSLTQWHRSEGLPLSIEYSTLVLLLWQKRFFFKVIAQWSEYNTMQIFNEHEVQPS